jgi:hypothetical protein
MQVRSYEMVGMRGGSGGPSGSVTTRQPQSSTSPDYLPSPLPPALLLHQRPTGTLVSHNCSPLRTRRDISATFIEVAHIPSRVCFITVEPKYRGHREPGMIGNETRSTAALPLALPHVSGVYGTAGLGVSSRRGAGVHISPCAPEES